MKETSASWQTRRSIRLRGGDYTQIGAYFFTICAHERACVFGTIADGAMNLNADGRIVWNCWHALPNHFPNIAPDEFIVMLNHVHGLIRIMEKTGDGEISSPRGTAPHSLGAILQNFKSVSARAIKRRRGVPGAKVWQRNYFERIVRDEKELIAIQRYILENPLRWPDDKNHPAQTQDADP